MCKKWSKWELKENSALLNAFSETTCCCFLVMKVLNCLYVLFIYIFIFAEGGGAVVSPYN